MHLDSLNAIKQKTRIQIWLYEQTDTRIEGVIIGMDEYMNLVIDDADECSIKKETRKQIGTKQFFGKNLSFPLSERALRTRSQKLTLCDCPCILGRILLKGDNVTLIAEAPQK